MSYFIENISINLYNNSYYIISNDQGFCFDMNHNFIKESNDWCYLIRGHTQIPSISNKKCIFIEENVIPLITSFNTGVHAYSGIYSIAMNYFEKVSEPDYKFIVYKNLQPSVIEVLNELFGEKIIFLDPNTLYKFKSILLIPNSLHSFLENKNITRKISDIIFEKIIFKNKLNFKYNNIAIIKTSKSSVSSNMGTIDTKIAQNFCEKHGYQIIEPCEIGEINTMKILNQCENVIFSWGTTFMKNYIYLSDKCRKTDVLIFGEPFMREYQVCVDRNILFQKYKNSNFTYHKNLTEENLQKLDI